MALSSTTMADIDRLTSRWQLTVVENRLLRAELDYLCAERRHAAELLQALVFENASLRAEINAMRAEMIHRRSLSPHGPLYPPVLSRLVSSDTSD